MTTYSSPLLARIAARRSSAQQQGTPVGSPSIPVAADPQPEPTSSAPFVPEWRRRAVEAQARALREHGTAYVAVLDTTSLA